MTIDTSELRRLAEAVVAAKAVLTTYCEGHPRAEDDGIPDTLMSFLKARTYDQAVVYDPATILALLDEIDALKAEREGGQ